MSQIVNTLPALPDDLPYDNYLLFLRLDAGDYFVANFDYVISDKLDSNGLVVYNQGFVYIYNHTSDSWDYYGTQFSFPDVRLIASSVDIYNSDGSIYCYATNDEYFTSTISLISTSITSSTFTFVFNEVKLLLPLLVVVLVCLISFRKSWLFLRRCIKGA